MTLQPAALLLIAAVPLLLATVAVLEWQVSARGIQPAQPVHWNTGATAHSVVAAPAAEPAQTSGPVTRYITGAPGGAPVAPAVAAPAPPDQRSNPAPASQCPTKPGSGIACSVP